MSTTRIIRELWLLGNAGLLAALVLPPPAHIIVMGAADVVLAVAWVMAIYRACTSRQWLWAFAIAVWPLAMWVYIFRPHDATHAAPVEEQPTQPLPSHDPGPDRPYADVTTQKPDEPLAVRQALEAIREAERRHPEW